MAKSRRSRLPGDRYVALTHWLMATEAWRDLDCVSRCTYIEIARRYAGRGSNNGRIPYSVRELAQALKVSKSTASRALASLEEHGFIVCEKKGHYDFKLRHSSEWRLTEFPSDVTGELPTKEFARWRKNPVPSQDLHRSSPETERVSS